MERAIRGYVGRPAPHWRSTDRTQSRAVQPPGELAVQTGLDGDAVVVALAGELDLPVAPLVRDALVRALREPYQRLIIDLSGLTFIDSSGLYAILHADKRCREAGRMLTIRPGPPNVQKVFELTNTIDCLPFSSSA
ncbi:MAG: STAS domain-containing protein [Solirubrobacteraceae bacterium]